MIHLCSRLLLFLASGSIIFLLSCGNTPVNTSMSHDSDADRNGDTLQVLGSITSTLPVGWGWHHACTVKEWQMGDPGLFDQPLRFGEGVKAIRGTFNMEMADSTSLWQLRFVKTGGQAEYIGPDMTRDKKGTVWALVYAQRQQ